MTPARFAHVARWALWALVAIVITGSLVRLTGSGLGCSDWPTCEPGNLVPVISSTTEAFHAWVEFGNRIVTGLVSIAVIAAVGASLWRQPRRADLIWWSLALVAGVAFQIGLGAVTVLTHLSPQIVMSHFLASQVLVAAAVVLQYRAERVPTEHLSTAHDVGGSPQPRANTVSIRAHAGLIGVLTAAALFTGTVVTGTGPHGGDENVERLQFALPSVARIHGITVAVLAAATLLFGLRVRRLAAAHRDSSPGFAAADLQRRVRVVIGVMAIQALIGYVQYFNELPVLLVALHVIGATLLTISVTRLVLASGALWLPVLPSPVESMSAGGPVGIASRGFAE